MKQIWKYKLPVDGYQSWVEMPEGSEIICVHEQDSHVCLWAIVDPSNENLRRFFEIFGTGHSIQVPTLKYVGTAFMKTGLVWHVFEEVTP